MMFAPVFRLLCASVVPPLFSLAVLAAEPSPPTITDFSVQGNTRNLRFEPYPGAEGYTIQSATNGAGPFVPDPDFGLAAYTNAGGTNLSSYEWRSSTASGPAGFYQVEVTPMDSNALLSAIALSRLTYGTTPDERSGDHDYRLHEFWDDLFCCQVTDVRQWQRKRI